MADKKESKGLLKFLRENSVLIIIAVAAFAIVYLGMRAFVGPNDIFVNGLRVQAGANAHGEMAAILSRQKIVLRGQVEDVNQSIPGQSAAMAEIASALSTSGRNVTVQGYVEGGGDKPHCVDADRKTVACLQPQVVVVEAGCNCVRPLSDRVEVSGSDEWLLVNSARLRGVFKWALAATASNSDSSK
ncbi:hypothetical protein HY995_02050 [Candidatus Micrarchaeota archaeon]|nr:hypothetical protein [Candidatus Micrarchaeota archaeon]MBI5176850.1 hypothetical protein [Candidatus Micrarchaeota archaeon]